MGEHDAIDRAHLRDPRDASHTIHRYAPTPGLEHWIRRYWLPVWSVPAGQHADQHVLQYPVCLTITTPDYSRLVGPHRGLSTTRLEGTSWGFGSMLQPAAGSLLLGVDVSVTTDAWRDLGAVPLLADATDGIREVMRDDPSDAAAHAAARGLLEERLAELGEPDEESLLVNAIAEAVEADATLTSTRQLAVAFDLTERALQRLTARRLGLTPLWLIRRRRLHEAAERLRHTAGSLAEVAATLGYSDQAHFSRDWRAATGTTPGEFARLSAADM